MTWEELSLVHRNINSTGIVELVLITRTKCCYTYTKYIRVANLIILDSNVLLVLEARKIFKNLNHAPLISTDNLIEIPSLTEDMKWCRDTETNGTS